MIGIYDDLVTLGHAVHERWSDFAREYPNTAALMELAAEAATVLGVGEDAAHILHQLGVHALGVAEHAQGIELLSTVALVHVGVMDLPEGAVRRLEGEWQERTAAEEKEMWLQHDAAANDLEMRILQAVNDAQTLDLAEQQAQQHDTLADAISIDREAAIEQLQRSPQDIGDLYVARDLETMPTTTAPELATLEAQQDHERTELAEQQAHEQSELSARLLAEPAHRSLDNPEAQIMDARHEQERANLDRSIEDSRGKLESRLELISADTADVFRTQFEAAATQRQDDLAARQAEEARRLLEQERDRDTR